MYFYPGSNKFSWAVKSKNLSWIYPHTHDYGNLKQIQLLASHLPQVIKEEEKAPLAEEFMDYCTSELPPQFTKLATAEIDTYWHRVAQITDSLGKLRYPLLTKLAKSVLIIPHGNADIERMFSHLGLNKTKLRNSLSVDTLTALLRLQFNIKQPCFSFTPTEKMITRCKNAISSLNSNSE